MTDIEQILLNRVKFIGDGEWKLSGTPQELIDEINRLLVEAKRDQIDEIIDIQEKQFNRWTQKDIAHFFERVGVIYRKLKKELGDSNE